FEGEKPGGVSHSSNLFHSKANYHADDRRRHDTEGQQPLENSGTLASIRGGQALREIERHDHADQSGADALQQPAKHQRLITMRESNHWNADDEQNAAERHQEFATDPIGQRAGKHGRDDATKKNCGNHDGKLPRIEAGSGLQVWQGAGDDAHIDTVKQAAQTGYQQQKAVVAGLFVAHSAVIPSPVTRVARTELSRAYY